MRGVKPPRYPTLWEACANRVPAGEPARGQRIMLYFYLLLARLEARNEIGRPSFERLFLSME